MPWRSPDFFVLLQIKMIEIRKYNIKDEDSVIQLWNDCELIVPWNNPHLDIQRKLEIQPEMFLVGCLSGKIVATVMAGYEGHRGWINYLAIHPEHRRKGIGKRIMMEAETLLRAVGCPKTNLQVRTTNSDVISFYKAIGYKIDDVVSLGKRLEIDT